MVQNEVSVQEDFSQFLTFLNNQTPVDPWDELRFIGKLESWLDHGLTESLAIEVFGRDKMSQFYQEGGKVAAIQTYEIYVRTLIASAKLKFYLLGLLRTPRNGDLREAEIVEDENDQLFALLRIRHFRSDPRTVRRIQQEVPKMDPVFFARLARVLKKPAINFEHLLPTKLQKLLLTYWVGVFRNKKGEILPPLCVLSDPAIAKFAKIMLNLEQEPPSRRVCKTWERLGLRKAEELAFWDIEARFGKIIISQFRPRRN